jgi:hypothetical protein
MSNRPRQRHAASSAASETSDDESSSTAKTAPAAAAAASAELSPEAAAAETQRALRFVVMLSVSILVAPLAAYFVTQHVFAFSASSLLLLFR